MTDFATYYARWKDECAAIMRPWRWVRERLVGDPLIDRFIADNIAKPRDGMSAPDLRKLEEMGARRRSQVVQAYKRTRRKGAEARRAQEGLE